MSTLYLRPIVRFAAVALLFVLCGPALTAQSVLDPQIAEFDPSPDHDVLAADGTPLVQSYSLELYVAGNTSPWQTVSLGKPARAADGKIRVNFASLLTTPPAPGVVYEARVSATGPGGSTASALSNTFGYSPGCAPSISPATQSFTAASGSGSVTVSAAAGCAWSAASNAAWITITSSPSGSGGGTVTFTVAANTATSARTGTLTIAGQTFTVTQSGAATCTYTTSTTSQNVLAAGGSFEVGVTTGASCTWTATSNAAWISVSGAASRTGSGELTYTVAANPTSQVRTGTLTVAGRTVTVSQQGTACSFTVTPASVTVARAGGTGSLTVTGQSGCTWTASTTASWITIASGSRSGSGTVDYTIAPNTATQSRTGTIVAAGTTVTFTQAAAPPAPRAPAGLRILNGGGGGS